MRQKYKVSFDNTRNIFKIREYAIITHIPKTATTLTIKNAKYSLLGEETYDKQNVMRSMSRGRRALIGSLRTKNIFPIEPYAGKIADAVVALSKSDDDGSLELLFDDVDLIPVPQYDGKE